MGRKPLLQRLHAALKCSRRWRASAEPLIVHCPYAKVLDFSDIKCRCERCRGVQVTMDALRSRRWRAFLLSRRTLEYGPSTERVRAYPACFYTL